MIDWITWHIYDILSENMAAKIYRVHDLNFVRKINVYLLSE